MRMTKSRLLALVVTVFFSLATLPPQKAHADPDPVLASLMSIGSTLIPIAVGTGLLLTGRGADEGIRFDAGLGSVGIGSIGGPSVGMLYAGAGVDMLITLLLRVLTGGIMVAGMGLRLRGGEDVRGLGLPLLVVGAIPTAFLAIYDFISAASTAKESSRNAGVASAPLIPPEILSVARCGAIPCSTRGRW